MSEASANVNQTGVASFATTGQTSAKVADNFTVPGAGWTVNSITGYAFMNSSGYPNPPSTSPITNVLVEIWNAVPSNSITPIASSATILSNSWTNIYRTLSGATFSDRTPVFAITADFGGLELAPADYWVSFNFRGTSPSNGVTGATSFIMSTDGTGDARDRGRQRPAVDAKLLRCFELDTDPAWSNDTPRRGVPLHHQRLRHAGPALLPSSAWAAWRRFGDGADQRLKLSDTKPGRNAVVFFGTHARSTDKEYLMKKRDFAWIVIVVVSLCWLAAPTARAQYTIDTLSAWGGSVNGFQRIGNIGYCAIGMRLVALDMTDEANIHEIGSVLLPGDVLDVAVRGQHAYVCTRSYSSFAAVDISNPASMQIVWRLPPRTQIQHPEKIRFYQNFVYVSDASGVYLYDLTNPGVRCRSSHAQTAAAPSGFLSRRGWGWATSTSPATCCTEVLARAA